MLDETPLPSEPSHPMAAIDVNLSRPRGDMQAHYDVVIIGSGYGGGVSAARLARAGKRVAVLERGREVRTGDFPVDSLNCGPRCGSAANA